MGSIFSILFESLLSYMLERVVNKHPRGCLLLVFGIFAAGFILSLFSSQ